MPATRPFFHGTTLKQARKIEKLGFGPGYLTQCSEQAWYYAEEAAEQENESLDGISAVECVLVIDVPEDDLRVDYPSIEEPMTFFVEKHGLRTGDHFHEALSKGLLQWPENDRDWEHGLRLTDSVYFLGAVAGHQVDMPDNPEQAESHVCAQEFAIQELAIEG